MTRTTWTTIATHELEWCTRLHQQAFVLVHASRPRIQQRHARPSMSMTESSPSFAERPDAPSAPPHTRSAGTAESFAIRLVATALARQALAITHGFPRVNADALFSTTRNAMLEVFARAELELECIQNSAFVQLASFKQQERNCNSLP